MFILILHILWSADEAPAYTITDHCFDTYNFFVRDCSYSYEFKQWFSEYDPVRGVVGNLINEIKNLGNGHLDAYDAENHNWSDYHSGLRGWNCTVLASHDLMDKRWYAFGGYTSIGIESLRGTDDWKVESDIVTFRWDAPDN